jgi:hypothetical protein
LGPRIDQYEILDRHRQLSSASNFKAKSDVPTVLVLLIAVKIHPASAMQITRSVPKKSKSLLRHHKWLVPTRTNQPQHHQDRKSSPQRPVEAE